MSKILISYRRSDSDVFAGRIRDRIAGRYGDASIFMDIDNIPFGKDFRQHIKDALAESDLVVVVVGPRWLGTAKSGAKSTRSRIEDENDLVRIEVETALQRGMPIVPVLVGDTKMPAPSQLPQAIRNFAFLNAAPVDTGRDFHPHVERLLRNIDEILGERGGQARIGPTRAAGRDRKAGIFSGALISRAGLALVGTALLIGVAVSQVSLFSPLLSVGWKWTAVNAPHRGPSIELASVSLAPVDCQEAKTSVDRMVCGTEELLTKHQLLNRLYAFRQSRLPSDDRLKTEQLSWRRALSECWGEGMFGCINNAHDVQIAKLKTGPSYPCHLDKNRVEQAIRMPCYRPRIKHWMMSIEL